MADERPIIIKKVKKGGGGHHGGAWKLAYADFVTAMMAFFLLMWLLGSTTDGDKKGIADYFSNPWKPSLSGGKGSGDATSVLNGGGEDLTRTVGQVKRTNKGTQEKVSVAAEETEGTQNSRKTGAAEKESTAEDAAGARSDAVGAGASSEAGESGDASDAGDAEQKNATDVINLKKTKEKLQDLISKSELLSQYSQQFHIDITTEGLRIQIVDEDKRPMFDLGSTRMEAYATEIMRQIAPVIDQLPNRISVTGHTDGRPYGGGGRYYSNWELSADRANAARRALVVGGIKENKFLRIVGLADSVPLDPSNALNPINRRISVIVMKRTAEQELMENSGPTIEVGKGAAPPPPGLPTILPPVLPAKPITPPVQPSVQSTLPTARSVAPSTSVLPPPVPITQPSVRSFQPPLPATRSAVPSTPVLPSPIPPISPITPPVRPSGQSTAPITQPTRPNQPPAQPSPRSTAPAATPAVSATPTTAATVGRNGIR
ncbi:chemotaxis protein MotB [Gammaproteobacteria bacterium]